MDAFDADVLIYSVIDDARGLAIRRTLFESDVRMGSNLLLLELLRKPLRAGATSEAESLTVLLSTLELRSADDEVINAALGFSVKYRLKTADAIHLATAVVWGADRFHTNNRKDFGPHITEIDVVHPAPTVG